MPHYSQFDGYNQQKYLITNLQVSRIVLIRMASLS